MKESLMNIFDGIADSLLNRIWNYGEIVGHRKAAIVLSLWTAAVMFGPGGALICIGRRGVSWPLDDIFIWACILVGGLFLVLFSAVVVNIAKLFWHRYMRSR